MICGYRPGVDTCSGDSGGPLLNRNGTIVGIPFYGISCALPGIFQGGVQSRQRGR
jgi:secreted trypsin-like serine protease